MTPPITFYHPWTAHVSFITLAPGFRTAIDLDLVSTLYYRLIVGNPGQFCYFLLLLNIICCNFCRRRSWYQHRSHSCSWPCGSRRAPNHKMGTNWSRAHGIRLCWRGSTQVSPWSSSSCRGSWEFVGRGAHCGYRRWWSNSKIKPVVPDQSRSSLNELMFHDLYYLIGL